MHINDIEKKNESVKKESLPGQNKICVYLNFFLKLFLNLKDGNILCVLCIEIYCHR